MVLHQVFMAVALVAGAALVAGVVSAPGDVVDVHVTQDAQWHPIQGRWELHEPTVDVEESMLISWRSMARNALTFGVSDSRPVEYRLEDADGNLVQSRAERTGFGIPIVNQRETLTVTFRTVEPGAYAVHVILYDEGLNVEQEDRFPLTIV